MNYPETHRNKILAAIDKLKCDKPEGWQRKAHTLCNYLARMEGLPAPYRPITREVDDCQLKRNGKPVYIEPHYYDPEPSEGESTRLDPEEIKRIRFKAWAQLIQFLVQGTRNPGKIGDRVLLFDFYCNPMGRTHEDVAEELGMDRCTISRKVTRLREDLACLH